MFDVFTYPVSAVLWLWHRVFGAVFGPASGIAWALAIAFLVFTIRALLIKPALHQLRSARRTQQLAPQVAVIRKKYRTDRNRQAAEMQKLYADNGVSMFGGIGPMLLQLPVVLSLYGVLRGFAPGATSNRIFDRSGVDSFLGAHLFGARIGNWISQPAADLLQAGTGRPELLAVGLPLILLAGAATFLSMRLSMRRSALLQADPQVPAISRLMPYLAPLGLLVSGLLFPVPLALLLYFLATNVWTLGQTHFLGRKVDREFSAAGPPKVKRPSPIRQSPTIGR
jgi:YidC/Oxa1 family membrane protein insertase